MTPALGRALILLTLLAASAGAVLAFVAASRRLAAGWAWTRRFVYAYAALIGAANALMVYALLRPDSRSATWRRWARARCRTGWRW